MTCVAFDCDAPAELYMPKRKSIGRRPASSYRRFAKAAEAIRFAVEELPAIKTLGTWMQVGDLDIGIVHRLTFKIQVLKAVDLPRCCYAEQR